MFAIFMEMIVLDVSSLYLSDAISYWAIDKSVLFCLSKISPVNSWIYAFVDFDENFSIYLQVP